MRILMMTAAVLAVGACNRGAANNSAAANTAAPAAATANAAAPAPKAMPVPTGDALAAAPATAAGLPDGFPASDQDQLGAECIVYMGLAGEANSMPGGRDRPILEQAIGQWRSGLQSIGQLSEQEIDQLVGSTVNPLSSTAPAQRDAAAAWCVENAPEVDPEG